MTEWWVAFSRRYMIAETPWYLRGFHPSYAHCFAFRALDATHILTVNQVGIGMQVLVDKGAPEILAGILIRNNARQVLTITLPPAPLKAGLRGRLTCVGVVKALMGLDCPLVITPRQLDRYLRRIGAQQFDPTMNKGA